MTREDAKKLFEWEYEFTTLSFDDVNEYIDKIYDDFESRTCGNCKHEPSCLFVTMCEDCKIDYVESGVKCNKFERKEK